MQSVAIIPVFNESNVLSNLITKTLGFVDHVVVVDDGSREPIAKKLPAMQNVTVLRHLVNLGKGASLTTGMQWALRQRTEYVVFLDGDGQHDPVEIPSLLTTLREGAFDVVFGCRQFHASMPLVARLGNIYLTNALRIMFGIQVSDTQSGFRAIRTAAYEQLAWSSPRYAVETEMIVNAGKHKLTYTEVPISTIYLNQYKGTTVIDGLKIFINMLTWKFL